MLDGILLATKLTDLATEDLLKPVASNSSPLAIIPTQYHSKLFLVMREHGLPLLQEVSVLKTEYLIHKHKNLQGCKGLMTCPTKLGEAGFPCWAVFFFHLDRAVSAIVLFLFKRWAGVRWT